MAVYVNTNVGSLVAQRTLGKSQADVQKSLTRLSTGLRINSAADDSAGLAISEKFKANLRSLEQSRRNASDGISLIQTAESSIEQMQSILGRMRELAVQSANGTLTGSDRQFLDSEFTSLRSELDRIAETSDFNGLKLLQGSASSGISFQVGINAGANDTITVSIANTKASKLGGTAASTKLDQQQISQVSLATSSLSSIDAALTQLSGVRSDLGTIQNRLDVAINNTSSQIENLSAANQRIRDVDVARESAALTRGQILTQAGVSVLAQANQAPQTALSLIG